MNEADRVLVERFTRTKGERTFREIYVMNENFEDELNTAERQALTSLAREKAPPAVLEERVVASLKELKLVRPSLPFWRRKAPQTGLAVAASLLIFILGLVIGMNWTASQPTANSPQFMLVLLAGTEPQRPKSSEEIMSIVREYSDWASQLRQEGVRVEGEKLKREARMLRAVDGRPVSEDRPADQKAIAGYFVIEAQDFNHAVRIASGCPHLKYGGTIEVRQIDRF